jgi:hypothetical protein
MEEIDDEADAVLHRRLDDHRCRCRRKRKIAFFTAGDDDRIALALPGHAKVAPHADRIERDERDSRVVQLLGEPRRGVRLAAVANAQDRTALAAEFDGSISTSPKRMLISPRDEIRELRIARDQALHRQDRTANIGCEFVHGSWISTAWGSEIIGSPVGKLVTPANARAMSKWNARPGHISTAPKPIDGTFESSGW